MYPPFLEIFPLNFLFSKVMKSLLPLAAGVKIPYWLLNSTFVNESLIDSTNDWGASAVAASISSVASITGLISFTGFKAANESATTSFFNL